MQKKSLAQFVCAKTSENSCYLIIATHHIIIDGWCADIVLEDFENFLKNPDIEGISEHGLYENAVREIISKDKVSAVNYYAKLLEGYKNKADIPSYGKVSSEEKYFDDQVEKIIPHESVAKLEAVCKKSDATLATGLELIWGMAMRAVCRLYDVVFAKVVSGRDNSSFDVSNIVGLFINSVPVRVKFDKNATATKILQNLHKEAVEGKEFEFCPLADIQQAAGMSEGLIYSIISVENYSEKRFSALKPALVREEH